MGIFDNIGKAFRGGGPRQRMSFDMKLSYAYFLPMMILFMASGVSGRGLPLLILLGIPGVLLVVLAALSAAHKIKHGWRWPGLTAGRALGALLNILWGLIFLAFVAGMPLPREERPWRKEGVAAILEASCDVLGRAISHPGFGPLMVFESIGTDPAGAASTNSLLIL